MKDLGNGVYSTFRTSGEGLTEDETLRLHAENIAKGIKILTNAVHFNRSYLVIGANDEHDDGCLGRYSANDLVNWASKLLTIAESMRKKS